MAQLISLFSPWESSCCCKAVSLPFEPCPILDVDQAAQNPCIVRVRTLKSVHRELKTSPDSEGHTSCENELSRRVCSMIAEVKLLLTDSDSSIDVLVIGAGPTGLGAAKRLNQLVRKCPYIRAGIDLMSHTERALMDDC